MKEERNMKIMVIKDNKGYYINPAKINPGSDNLVEIEKISKEDIFDIIDYMIDNDIDMDEFKDGLLPNPAQETIYKNLYLKLIGVNNSKKNIISEVNDKFKDAEEKYIKASE